MKKHINVPVFIPHYGCPNGCVFCNQVRITGKPNYDETSVRDEIDTTLSTIDTNKTETELAFFGGSFTAIPRSEMLSLLQIANEYVKDGRITSIRLSTRPDAIDDEVLNILASHNVKTIELGIQSTSPDVLSLCKRGHTKEDSKRACELIKKRGFELVGQMMTGLPGSTPDDEIMTARDISDFGADGARIYPTVVLPGTELARMEKSGIYTALSIEEATERCASVLDVFVKRGVKVIRIGLCANEILERDASHESYHAAIGELVRSRLYRKRIEEKLLLAKYTSDAKDILCFVPKGKTSQVVAQKRANTDYLKNKFRLNSIKIIEDSTLNEYEIDIRPI